MVDFFFLFAILQSLSIVVTVYKPSPLVSTQCHVSQIFVKSLQSVDSLCSRQL